MSTTTNVWLNKTSPNPLVPNECILLNSLSKSSVLSLLTEASTYRDRYLTAIASDLGAVQDLSPSADYFTLTEWLTTQKVTLDKSDRRKFDMAVSKAYLETYGARPRIVVRPNEKGQYIHKSNGFRSEDKAILKEALKKVTSRTAKTTDNVQGDKNMIIGSTEGSRGHYIAPATAPRRIGASRKKSK